jgi:hypothetical protein
MMADASFRRYFVPCHKCDEWFMWPEDVSGTDGQDVKCPHCGWGFASIAKADLLKKGKWWAVGGYINPKGETAPGDVPSGYEGLQAELDAAFGQAATGKGKARHASDGVAFDQQPMMQVSRLLSGSQIDGPLFQVCKKTLEASGMAKRGEFDAARRELHGVITYAAGAAMQMAEADPSKVWRDVQTRRDVIAENETVWRDVNLDGCNKIKWPDTLPGGFDAPLRGSHDIPPDGTPRKRNPTQPTKPLVLYVKARATDTLSNQVFRKHCSTCKHYRPEPCAHSHHGHCDELGDSGPKNMHALGRMTCASYAPKTSGD